MSPMKRLCLLFHRDCYDGVRNWLFTFADFIFRDCYDGVRNWLFTFADFIFRHIDDHQKCNQ